MDLAAAVRAAAADAPAAAVDGIESIRAAMTTPARAAHLIGQCAHESMRFTRVAESLFFTTPERILAVWPGRFDGVGHAAQFTRAPEKLANHVYGGRMGNSAPGDGFRYRGRGYLQLTGRENYRLFGKRIGVDLEASPEQAEAPTTAWAIAAAYFTHRSAAGRTAFEWADLGNAEMVTRIVNGGGHGLADRQSRTALALAALERPEGQPELKRGDEGDAVMLLQRLLAARGFSAGAFDGDFGPRTERMVIAFQNARGLSATGRVDAPVWAALGPLVA